MADRRGYTSLYQNIPVQPLSGYSDPSAFIRVREAVRGLEDQVTQIRGLVGNSVPGYVSSVGLTAPTIFSVTGSPVTDTGTIALSLVSQTARSVFAAPTATAGTPSFRALEAADIQSGVFGITRGGTGLSSTPSNGQLLIGNGSGYTLATLTAGTGISITNGVGSIQIDNTLPGFLNPMTTLGDIIYGGAAGAATRLGGETTTTRKFLRSVGVAGNATAPAWDTVTKTDVGLGNVEDVALSTWAGSSNLTTLGTVTTGTWSATSIAPAKGGTGLTTAPAQDVIVYGGGSLSFSTLAPPSSGTKVLTWTSAMGITWTDKPAGTVTSVGMTVPTGLSVTPASITTSGTFDVTYASGYAIPTTASQANWDTAYNDRLKWDGGATGLVAATGRTSLGATTVGSNLFTLTNPSAVTFLRVNADNTVSTLDATTFRTAIGAGTGSGTVTAVTATSPVASSGGTTPAISLSAAYGDSQNPYGVKTANYVLAGPTTGAAAVPSFRALVAADIPSLSGTYLPLAGGTMSGAINMGTNDINSGGIFSLKGQRSYVSGGGGSGTNGYYAPVAKLTLTAQFQVVALTLEVTEGASSGDSTAVATAIVRVRLKQQNAMGAAPYIDVDVVAGASDDWDTDSFIFITTTNTAGTTEGTLYIEQPYQFTNITATVLDYSLSAGASYILCTASTTPTNALVAPASLPAGTQTKPVAMMLGGASILRFLTGSAERMRIASNGNVTVDSGTLFVDAVNNEVGIGTTSPGETLHVVGLSRFDKSSAAAYPNLRLRSVNDSYASTWALGQAPASNNFMVAHNDGTSWFEYLTFTTTGNIGIGNITPGAKLEFVDTNAAFNTTTPGTTRYATHFRSGATNDYATGITWAGNNGTQTAAHAGIYVQSSGSYGTKMYFATTNSYATGAQTAMTIDHNRYVGIGVAPSYLLHAEQTYTGAGGNVVTRLSSKVSPAATNANTQYGLFNTLTMNANATGSGRALYSAVQHRGASNAGVLSAGMFIIDNDDATTMGSTISDAVAVYAMTPSQNAMGGTITRSYGLYIQAQSGTNITTPYGVYQAGTSDKNIFAGNVRIGSTTTATNALDVTGAATVSGNFTVDTTTFHVDSTNDRVGIGTSGPIDRLSIVQYHNAATRAVVYNTDTGANASANFLLYTTANTGLELTSSGATNPNQLKLFSPLSGGVILEASNASGFFAVATGGTYPSSERFRITSAGNVGIATTTANSTLSFGGNSARTVAMERHTTSNTAGNSLTIQSGGATSGATDKDSGDLILVPGVSTGTGRTDVRIQSRTRNTVSATTDNSLIDRIWVTSQTPITDNVFTTVLTVDVPPSGFTGGSIFYTITATGTFGAFTDFVSFSSMVTYGGSRNAAGTLAAGTNPVQEADAYSNIEGSTMTVTWQAIAGTGNNVLIQVKADSSMSAFTTGYPNIQYTIVHNGRSGIVSVP